MTDEKKRQDDLASEEQEDKVDELPSTKLQLISRKSQFRVKNKDGHSTPSESSRDPKFLGERLVTAAANGDAALVSKLLLQGADVDYAEQKGAYTALIKACRMQRIEVVKMLIAAGADPNKSSRNGWTALIEACRVGHKELSEMLLDQKAEINFPNAMGWTCLVEACRNNHLHIVRLLCERGCNVASVDKDKLIPKEHTSNPAIHAVLNAAWENSLRAKGIDPDRKRQELREEQKRAATPGDKLADAAMKNNVAELKRLIEDEHYDINGVTSKGGYTALIMAARYASAEAAEYLLSKGAQINKQSTTGWTAMIEACRVGSEKLMHILYNHKAEKVDINLIQEFGWPPIIEACRNSHYEVVEQLIEWGALVDLKDRDGDAVIDHATQPWIISLLKDRVKYGDHGPQKQLKDVYSQAIKDKMDISRRDALVMQRIAEIERRHIREEKDEDVQNDVRRTVINVLIEEYDYNLIPEVLKSPEFKATIALDDELIRKIVQLPLPHDEKEPLARNALLLKVIDSVVDSLFDKPEDKAKYLDACDAKAKEHGALLAAKKFNEELTKAIKGKDVELEARLNWRSEWYLNILVHLLKLGSKIDQVGEKGHTILIYMLQLLERLQAENYFGALNHLLASYSALFDKYRSSITHELLNATVGESDSALCFLVTANESTASIKLVSDHVAAGAKAPTSKREFNRLIEYLRVIMTTEAEDAWHVSRSVVRNSDMNLLKRMIDEKMPVFMTEPQPRGKKVVVPRIPSTNVNRNVHTFSAEIDFGFMEHCLLHMAIEKEDREMFEILLDYSSQPLQSFKRRSEIQYPWPDQGNDKFSVNAATGKKEHPALGWTNSFGQNAFHIIANKKNKLPSDTNTWFFSKLITMDSSAIVSRPDRWGWCPVHYAAYHGKTAIINTLILSHIDLTVATFDTNSRNKSQTALHLAALQGNWAVCLALLEAKVDIEAIDKDGCTPLALAMLKRQQVVKSELDEQMKVLSSQALEDRSMLDALKVNSVTEFVPKSIQLLAQNVGELLPDELRNAASKGAGLVTSGAQLVASGVKQGATAVWDATGAKITGEIGKRLKKPKVSDQDSEKKVAAMGLDLELASLERHRSDDADDMLSDAYRERPDLSRPSLPEFNAMEGTAQDVQQLNEIRQRETYSMTIQALLSHGASIVKANQHSGKNLYELMNVSEKWFMLCRGIYLIEQRKEEIVDDYYKAISDSNVSFENRYSSYEEMNRELKVLDSRRHDLFLDKETQMVINQKYNENIKSSAFMKLIRFVIFLTCLTVLGIQRSTRDDGSAYFIQRSLSVSLPTNDYAESETSNLPRSFADINSDVNDFYRFLQDSFVPTLYPTSDQAVTYWKGSTQESMKDSVIGYQNHVIGVSRLRQVRSEVEDCDVPDSFKSFANVCFSDVRQSYSKENFGPAQKYKWYSSDDSGGVSLWGRIATYDGSGHIVYFPNVSSPTAATDAANLVTELKTNNFIDAATRAVFVEFTTFNPNEYLFSWSSLLLEFPRTGGIITSWEFQVGQFNRALHNSDRVVQALEFVVLAFVVMHLFSEIGQMLTQPAAYFQSAYNWLDLAIILFAPPIIALRAREEVLDNRIDWTSLDSFQQVQELARVQYIENILYSLVILVVWFKLFDYLAVFEQLYRMIIMVEMMSLRLVSWMAIFFLVLAGFTSAEYVAFGYLDPQSYTWLLGFIARIIGVFSQNPLLMDRSYSQRVLGTFFDILFIIISTMLLINLIIALLTSAYDQVLNAAGDELAMRQFRKLHEEGFSKLKRTIQLNDSEGGSSFTERVDDFALIFLSNIRAKTIDLWMRLQAHMNRASNVISSATFKGQPESGVQMMPPKTVVLPTPTATTTASPSSPLADSSSVNANLPLLTK